MISSHADDLACETKRHWVCRTRDTLVAHSRICITSLTCACIFFSFLPMCARSMRASPEPDKTSPKIAKDGDKF
ncbi:hypothetical protein PUN28_014922 [Cardiocondyla obscurior]|uniref:Uncharacterized protein n=1 Tax=Cardiocondyla obscurior TaxID=286306 RepID=A0AAW2F0J3_9HYME